MELAFLAAYLCVLAATLTMSFVNLRHQRREGRRVPPELSGVVEAERLARIEAYTVDRSRFGMLERAVSGLVTVVFLFAGPLGAYDRQSARFGHSFVARGTAFMLGLVLLQSLLGLPFSYYRSFVIEARHGFNRMSRGLFFGDFAKSLVLGLAFAFVLSVGAFWLVRRFADSWWLWVWLAFAGFSLLVTFISPYVIEPLFFRMEPLGVEGLEREVKELADRAGVHVGRVRKMDASRRSAHSNAYFTGLGRVKRVVLFDTLLEQMTHAEILAVLSHELGHWKKHHVLVRTVAGFVLSFCVAFVVFRVVGAPFVPALVGLPDASFAARLVVLGVVGSLLGFPLTPLGSAWSRHDEWQADRFAVELSACAPALASALAKLSRENLANLHPHPLYAKFYYSHPPVTERIRRLRELPS
ncbi:MAG TPA: M48 family metallopeptidase [Polyangiaceae bacterium]|nr:M48 family metallopeptidase [Polyangiaceae bacterium]